MDESDRLRKIFVKDVKAFVKTHGLQEHRFGYAAAGDPNFVRDFDHPQKSGKLRVFHETIQLRVRKWMAAYEKNPKPLNAVPFQRSRKNTKAGADAHA